MMIMSIWWYTKRLEEDELMGRKMNPENVRTFRQLDSFLHDLKTKNYSGVDVNTKYELIRTAIHQLCADRETIGEN